MKKNEAYYFVFDIIFDYWKTNKLIELGDMLSEMSPYTFVADEKISADPAVFSNWQIDWEKTVGTDKEATSEQVYSVAKTILDYYSNEVKYDIGNSRSVLQQGLGLASDQFRKAV